MTKKINDFIKKSIEEDIGSGDVTSIACIKKGTIGEAQLIAKEPCQIAGIDIAKKIYTFYDKNLDIKPFFKDGDSVKKNSVIFLISGDRRSILATERLVLNCMQRMSGIATKTHKFINKLKGLNTIILDTRKTCPNIRFLDKEAVKIGGGENHRNGLYDTIMIKDNHIDFCGNITRAIEKSKNYVKKYKRTIPIIIEVRNLKELHKVLDYGGVDRILLDNFTITNTKKAVKIVKKKYPLESSGNINIYNVRNYALCGVNYISIGNLTHSVKSTDLSMICI